MDLQEIRKRIDEIDMKIVELVSERVSLIPKIAEYKSMNDIPRVCAEREQEILGNKRDLAEKLGIDPDLVEDIFKRLIEESHKIEKEIMGE